MPPARAKAKKIDASPLQIEIANRVLELIQSGAVAPGDHLTEDGLSKSFGVSRTPVRFALRMLESTGVVELRTNAGTFVSSRLPKLELFALKAASVGEDELYRSILSNRASGVLPGTFSEAALISRFSAPKAMLRRVLVRLAREGLIERRRGHGWSFLPAFDTDEAVQDSYRFRKLVECGGFYESTFRLDVNELMRARAIQLEFIEKLTKPKGGLQAGDFYRMNANFHEMLARLSGNRFVEQAVWQQNQLRRFEEYATFINRPMNLASSCQDHVDIIDALLEGDKDWASALLKRHLTVSSQR